MVRRPGFEPGVSGLGGPRLSRYTSNSLSGSTDPLHGVIQRYLDHGLDNHEIKGFMKWCLESASRETCSQYVSYLRKPLDRNNRWSVKAYKKYFKYIGREDLWSLLKAKKSGVDQYVPSDERVIESLRKAKARDVIYHVYRQLLFSGLRLREVVYLLKTHETSKWIKISHDTRIFYRYPLLWERRSKQVFYHYTAEIPPRIVVNDKAVSTWARKHGLVNPKYIRKWVATKMIMIGIPNDVVNYIQGRVSREVLSKHYLDLLVLADKNYPRYLEYIEGLGLTN